jgi:hypothetical protein
MRVTEKAVKVYEKESGFICDICKTEYRGETYSLPLSTLTITSQYGSKYDEEDITKDICDKCMPTVLDLLKEHK